jgi:DNA-binding IclR family transcriptional regulator
MSQPVPAAERTLHLLELLLRFPEGFTPQEFLAHLDISRSSLFSLLQTLKSLGYVEQSGLRGRYIAGARLLSWRSVGVGGTSDLLTAFYQETNPQNLDETIALFLPNSNSCFVLAQVESTQMVRTSFEIGQSFPLDTSTPGLFFIQDPPREIREQAYRLVQTDEVTELAIPICSDGLHPDAAIMLSSPSYRLRKEKALSLLPALREIATRISYRLGAHTYKPFSTIESLIRPTQAMSIEEIKEFLDGPWAARLACMRPDGTLHVVPIWYEFRRSFFIGGLRDPMWAHYSEKS